MSEKPAVGVVETVDRGVALNTIVAAFAAESAVALDHAQGRHVSDLCRRCL